MRSLFITYLITLLLIGCHSSSKQDASVQSLILKENIKKAQSQGDYRLYATSGRRLVFPGIDSSLFKEVNRRCGKKYLPNMGDVITSAEEKSTRNRNFRYMTLFNELMIVDCFNTMDR